MPQRAPDRGKTGRGSVRRLHSYRNVCPQPAAAARTRALQRQFVQLRRCSGEVQQLWCAVSIPHAPTPPPYGRVREVLSVRKPGRGYTAVGTFDGRFAEDSPPLLGLDAEQQSTRNAIGTRVRPPGPGATACRLRERSGVRTMVSSCHQAAVVMRATRVGKVFGLSFAEPSRPNRPPVVVQHSPKSMPPVRPRHSAPRRLDNRTRDFVCLVLRTDALAVSSSALPA